MKNIMLLFLLTLISLNVIAQDHNHDHKAIIQTLETESSAYYSGDYDLWQKQWLHSDDAFHAWNKKDGTYFFARGWNKINEYFEESIQNQKEVIHPNFELKNVKIHIDDELAYVIYDEYVANKENTHYSLAPGVKFLRKDNGIWKLLGVNSYWNYTYDITKSELMTMEGNNE